MLLGSIGAIFQDCTDTVQEAPCSLRQVLVFPHDDPHVPAVLRSKLILERYCLWTIILPVS